MKVPAIFLGLGLLIMGLFLWFFRFRSVPPPPVPEAPNFSLAYPIKNFSTGILKKPFGIFVTPQDSPIQPERFRGYHTGADVEVASDDQKKEIPVFAIASGIVVESGYVNGYGGLIVVKHSIQNQQIFSVYGHLKPSSLVSLGQSVFQGQAIGVLGDAYSQETDQERKHLHFGLYRGEPLDIRGYTLEQKQLVNWLDPVKFFQQYRTVLPQ